MAQKPQRQPHRLRNYDYAQPGAYFITIVTFQRKCLFGEIKNGVMILNATGNIVLSEWQRLKSRFPQIELDEFAIMPNHLHGIIVIHDFRRRIGDSSIRVVLDKPLASLPAGEQFGNPVPGSIPTIIRSFKAAVSFRINLHPGNSGQPLWQRDYYDHIIRDEADWANIRLYIQTNPEKWERDDENQSIRR